jgi:hypothetical protein
MWVQVAGPQHLETAISLHNLAIVLRDLSRYGEAEALLARSLNTFSAQLGAGHPKVAELTEMHEEVRRLRRFSAAAGASIRAAVAEPRQ